MAKLNVSLLFQIHTICDEFDRSTDGGENVQKILQFERHNSRQILKIEKAATQTRFAKYFYERHT